MATWILTHGDTDGICAGALCLATHQDAHVYFTRPTGLAEDLEQAQPKDVVIICDIALSETKLKEVLDKFHLIADRGSLVYIDHHPLSPKVTLADIPGMVKYEIGPSATELAFKTFRSSLPPAMSRVAIYGAIGDYADDTPLTQELLLDWDKRALYFEVGILVQGLDFAGRDYEFKRKVLRELSKNHLPSTNKKLVNMALKMAEEEDAAILRIKEKVKTVGKVSYVLDPNFSLGKTAIYAKALTHTSIGIAGEPRNGVIDMSLRTSDKNIDLNKILRELAPKFGGTGGGHAPASGARVPKNMFEEFVEGLNAAL